jgi:peptidoglycan/LPS O-acetylase OafA/YrhL
VVIALQSKGIVKRLLCNPVLVYIGTISYTIYLIHLSVLYVLWPLHLNRYVSAASALAITLVYASITWFAFEKRLIFGARGKQQAQVPTHGTTHASTHAPAHTATHAPAGGGVARAGTAPQAPQSRA